MNDVRDMEKQAQAAQDEENMRVDELYRIICEGCTEKTPLVAMGAIHEIVRWARQHRDEYDEMLDHYIKRLGSGR